MNVVAVYLIDEVLVQSVRQDVESAVEAGVVNFSGRERDTVSGSREGVRASTSSSSVLFQDEDLFVELDQSACRCHSRYTGADDDVVIRLDSSEDDSSANVATNANTNENNKSAKRIFFLRR